MRDTLHVATIGGASGKAICKDYGLLTVYQRGTCSRRAALCGKRTRSCEIIGTVFVPIHRLRERNRTVQEGWEMEGKIVLLVEDNSDLRDIYATILQIRGYRVLEAADGESGIRHALELRPNLVLTDIQLGPVDGFEVVGSLKGDRGTRDIPVIAVTAEDRLGPAGDNPCWTLFDDFLQKPVALDRLTECVQRWIGPGEPATGGNPAAEESAGPEPHSRQNGRRGARHASRSMALT